MKLSSSIIIWFPSGVGPRQDQGKCALRLVDEVYPPEIGILWPSCFESFRKAYPKPSVTTVQTNLHKSRINLEDSEIVEFEEGMSNSRVFTVHGVKRSF